MNCQWKLRHEIGSGSMLDSSSLREGVICEVSGLRLTMEA
jgi:hypothetical protein